MTLAPPTDCYKCGSPRQRGRTGVAYCAQCLRRAALARHFKKRLHFFGRRGRLAAQTTWIMQDYFKHVNDVHESERT